MTEEKLNGHDPQEVAPQDPKAEDGKPEEAQAAGGDKPAQPQAPEPSVFPYLRNTLPDGRGGLEFIYTMPQGGQFVGALSFRAVHPNVLVAMAEDFLHFAGDAVKAANAAAPNPLIQRATAEALHRMGPRDKLGPTMQVPSPGRRRQ